MLRFIKQHLDTIHGVAIWPTLSFVLFFGIFCFVLWWVFTADKKQLDHMAATPLSDGHNRDVR